MAIKKSSIRQQVVKNMKDLGTYKSQYKNTIDIFSDMIYQYNILTEEFEKTGCMVEEEYTNKAGATNMRKTPAWSALEKLRMDISTYSSLLCLNPKSIESINIEIETKTSKLAQALDSLET